jgi:hypothetical protein
MSKKKKKSSESVIFTQLLLGMLKDCHLAGVMEECVLNVRKGQGSIEAVDITNSLMVMAKTKIADKSIGGSFGLGNLELLIKFLSMTDDKKMKVKNSSRQMNIQRIDGQRKLNYLLTEPELISTRLTTDDDEPTDPLEKLSGLMKYRVVISQKIIKDFLSYIGMLKDKDTTIEFDGEKAITFVCGGKNDHQLRLKSKAKVKGKSKKAFDFKLSGEHLARIFNAIDYDEEDPPYMRFAKKKPTIIYNKSTAWALMPVVGVDEGE